MPDDWSWFWAGESGRDNLLRDEIEGLQSRAYAASAQSARLSSQLRTLQGSIESRLQALSTAFDAYVELGDVREQLAGYPDTSAVRRRSVRALTVLDEGGVPEPLDADDVGYWLADATNEVIALSAGEDRTPPGPPVPSAGTEHETFVVAAAGWLGHGERVADRLAPLLLGDGALAAPQVVLWRALVHGRFGAALPAVREAWQRDLDLTAPTWERFATEAQTGSGPVATLRWVDQLLSGRWSPTGRSDGEPTGTPAEAVPVDGDRAALRHVVDALVGAGMGEERALLERARQLRARIEDPGAPEPDPGAEPARTPTTRLVQEAILDPQVGAEARAELLSWVRPGLEAAVTAIAADVARRQPAPRVVHTEMGRVEVTGAGADAGRLAELDRHAVERSTVARSRTLVPGVGVGVALVAGLALLATGRSGGGVLLLVLAVVLAVVLGRELLRARSARTELAAVRERTRQRVEEGRTAAAADEATERATKAEVASLARAVTGEVVGAPASTGTATLR